MIAALPKYVTAYGKRVLRIIPYPGPVSDGTPRCIQCGQIDDDPWHDSEICAAAAVTAFDKRQSAIAKATAA